MAGNRRKSTGSNGVEAEVSSPTEANPAPAEPDVAPDQIGETIGEVTTVDAEVLADYNAPEFSFDTGMQQALAGETVSWSTDTPDYEPEPVQSDRVQEEPIVTGNPDHEPLPDPPVFADDEDTTEKDS